MTSSPEGAPKPRLLVVDDEPVIGHVLRAAFEQAGYAVTDVDDGAKATELLERQTFDVALIDKNLPGVDGVQLCTQARERSAEMAVLLMTAYATRESAAELLQVGIDDYVEKPFELDALTERVGKILARKRKVLDAARAVEAVRARQGQVRRGQVMDLDEARREAVEAALSELGVEIHRSDEGFAQDAAVDALILSARLVDQALVERIWAVRAARPGLQVVILADRDSLDDDIAAIMVGASAEVAVPTEPAALREALSRAFGLGRREP